MTDTKGIFRIEIPELGNPIRGKVRDIWGFEKNGRRFRLMITTDRQSFYARPIGIIPGKGQISNLISAYWFRQMKDIVKSHMISIPHPNILLAHQVRKIPIEVVLRRYMAESTTSTSIYDCYVNKRRRKMYGIKFPEGLKKNQEFPMGTIVTSTTKAEKGIDKELTDREACEIVDLDFEDGTWENVKEIALNIFDRERAVWRED